MKRVAPISVAISTRDRQDALARCLESLGSGIVLPTEVIVVDQSASDARESIVQRWTHGTIRYIHQEPLGLAVSQNTAIAHATCSVVAIIDDDCVADPTWLATLEQTFGSTEYLAAVSGRVLPLPPDGERVYPVASRTSTVRRDFSGKSVPWPVGSGNNFAVKREWFSRIGGCDERLGPGSPGQGGMDMDLFYRLLRAGGRIRYEPDALVYHERQDKAGRLARRPMYGHGMGACCGLRLRERDWYALPLLGHWLLYRARLLAGGVLHRRWMMAQEEWLLLQSSVRGLVYGLLRKQPPRNSHEVALDPSRPATG